MQDIDFRILEDSQADAARQLSSRNPDVFTKHVLDRLPCFFEIAALLEPAELFLARQRLILGAFSGERLVGAVFVEEVDRLAVLEAVGENWDIVQERYSEHEVNVYLTLAADWFRLLIGAPDDAFSIHSLCVDYEYRRRGIAARLVEQVIQQLSDDQLDALYIEVARVRSHLGMCKSAGFRPVRRRFSIADRLQFGCWGTTLFRYDPRRADAKGD